MSNNNLRQLIPVIVRGFNLEASWEAGRRALFIHGISAENPYQKDTVDHDEWERGFVHALKSDDCQVEEIELTDVVEALPVMDVRILPERSFWAYAKLIQDKHKLTSEQLAARIGVNVLDLMNAMLTHNINRLEQPATGVRAVK